MGEILRCLPCQQKFLHLYQTSPLIIRRIFSFFNVIIRMVNWETLLWCLSMIAQLEPILDLVFWDFLSGFPRLRWLRMSEMIHWRKHLLTDWCWPNQIERAVEDLFSIFLWNLWAQGWLTDLVKTPENCQFTQTLSSLLPHIQTSQKV